MYYIRLAVTLSCWSYQGSLSVPWRSILSSVRVWAVAVTHFCGMWGFFTMKSCLPMYYKEILKFDITAVSNNDKLQVFTHRTTVL